MDLKTYYQRIREVSATLANESVVLVSRATPGGGRADRFTEVPREVAARMLVEGVADLATEAQATQFTQQTKTLQAEEESRRAAARIQVNVISEKQARALSSKPPKPRNERS